jgi:hypothetical protein
MDLKQAFLLRYVPIHDHYFKFYYDALTEEQFRQRPAALVNPPAWIFWHAARAEDIGVNRLATKGTQVVDENEWLEKMKVPFRHFGIGMTFEEVNYFAMKVDIHALHAYHQAVGKRTVDLLEKLDIESLDLPVPEDYLMKVLKDEGAVRNDNLAGVRESYLNKTRGWFLMHLGLTHTFQHVGEVTTVASLLGVQRS